MQPDDIARIPLRARDGSIRAYAVIDMADAEWASQWRWHLHPKGYATRSQKIDGIPRTFRLHRELLGLMRGDGLDVDHIDRDKLNCRRSNLRIVPKGKNSQNQPSVRGSTSRYRGVSWRGDPGQWGAYVKTGGKQYRLGQFASETEAAEAARLGRARLLPFAVD